MLQYKRQSLLYFLPEGSQKAVTRIWLGAFGLGQWTVYACLMLSVLSNVNAVIHTWRRL